MKKNLLPLFAIKKKNKKKGGGFRFKKKKKKIKNYPQKSFFALILIFPQEKKLPSPINFD